MVGCYIPSYIATWVLYIAHDEENTIIAMYYTFRIFINYFIIILVEVCPIVLFGSNVKLLKEYSKGTFKETMSQKSYIQHEDFLLIKTILK